MRVWGLRSAGLGALAWLATPWLPVGRPPAPASIEHVFLVLPLVVVPLALVLRATWLSSEDTLSRLVQRGQPVAAISVLASFCVPKGAAAGTLIALWWAMALLLAIDGIRRVRPRTGPLLSNASLLAAHLFLPVGATWLLLSRLGTGPRALPELTVFLAALHFHFSGFALQILISATGRRLAACGPRLAGLQRALAVATMGGIPLIAVGSLLHAPVLKFVGVSAMVCGTIALAITSAAVALASRRSAAKRLLLVSAGSIAAAMVVAAVYGVGELLGAYLIGVPRMVAIHGVVNSLGFTLCGLLGHLLQPRVTD